jgi:hypothetical protein
MLDAEYGAGRPDWWGYIIKNSFLIGSAPLRIPVSFVSLRGIYLKYQFF